ncbi:TPA: hypothetical protein ACH3X3_012573 [Trebouxia sp. C0006]
MPIVVNVWHCAVPPVFAPYPEQSQVFLSYIVAQDNECSAVDCGCCRVLLGEPASLPFLARLGCTHKAGEGVEQSTPSHGDEKGQVRANH